MTRGQKLTRSARRCSGLGTTQAPGRLSRPSGCTPRVSGVGGTAILRAPGVG
ncbi:hypothetical protein ACVXG7_17465 [Enterobacter hormaechei]